MRLSDLIQPSTPAGAALFLRWQDYHVFSIPKREMRNTPQQIRFFGVGGKRQDCQESFAACALRESQEEIGPVVSQVYSAAETVFLKGNGEVQMLHLADDGIQPRLIWEKQRHSDHGSMAHSSQSYYLVAFDGELTQRPTPRNEIAALLYLTDAHLDSIRLQAGLSYQRLIELNGQIDCQPGFAVPESATLVPHGTVLLLLLEGQQAQSGVAEA